MTVRVAVAPTNCGAMAGQTAARTRDHRPSAPTSAAPVHRLAGRARGLHAVVRAA